MKMVQLDWEDESHIRVTWSQGAQPFKHRVFDSRDAAENFARSKMGKTGYLISNLDMTAEQLADHRAREARARQMMGER